jgi:hypothetical protein
VHARSSLRGCRLTCACSRRASHAHAAEAGVSRTSVRRAAARAPPAQQPFRLRARSSKRCGDPAACFPLASPRAVRLRQPRRVASQRAAPPPPKPPAPASKLPPGERRPPTRGSVGRRSHRVAPRRSIVKSTTAATDLTMLRRGAFGEVSRRPTEPPGRCLRPPELSHSTARLVHMNVCSPCASVGWWNERAPESERVAPSSSLHRSTSAVRTDRQGFKCEDTALDDPFSRHYSPFCGDDGVMRGQLARGGRGNVGFALRHAGRDTPRPCQPNGVGWAARPGVASAGDSCTPWPRLAAQRRSDAASHSRCSCAALRQLQRGFDEHERSPHRRGWERRRGA